MEHLESVDVDSVADLTVPVDIDESITFTTEAEVTQQVPWPVAGPGMDPSRAEARDLAVAGARGCPKVT